MSCRIGMLGIGIIAPGLDGWEHSAPILAGRSPYNRDAPPPSPTPQLLQPILRRRTTATIRLALGAAEQAVAHAGLSPDSLTTLFSSSDGDIDVADALCRALATPDHAVSPTRFHNSVHNAPAAYWSIATGSRLPSTSIAVYGASFASGLLEAAAMVCAEEREVALVAYNSPAPHPMSGAVPVSFPFAVAMVLAPAVAGADCIGRMHLECAHGLEPDRASDHGLERLRQGNSAAHCLPLLESIAREVGQTLVLPYLQDTQLAVGYEPGDASPRS